MVDITLDATGLRCPMPLLKAKLQIGAMTAGQELEVLATDAGSARDIPAWLAHTGHELVSSDEEQGRFRFIIRVGDQE
ncbi:sulfurtransferase TusA family protein [Marinobacter sp. M1N3S26]|uniref:sulfurtransferase TusA family protein n=1 Tax=unclassified Marinobacter TaxID=83889 RepID=UPI00387B52EA